ncbi:MAG: DUF2142 domain-containing protein [Actinomycetota bacterium]|nr:DUF2142 domain-containing protein [Actinomycetota bacterium]
MCAGWAVTSPVGSAPDDDYHLSSIWCGGGIQSGVCELDPAYPDTRKVPRNVVDASDCYRFLPGQTARCQWASREDTTMVWTERVNDIQGLYPSGFYKVMSVFVGPNVERSVVAMRLFNSLLAALLMAAIMRLTPKGIASAAMIAIPVSFIPLGIFVTVSTNPSAWTIIGLAGFWAFALSWLHRGDPVGPDGDAPEDPQKFDRRSLLLGCGTFICAFLAMSSRVDSNVYVVLATLVVLTMHGWRKARRQPVRLASLGLLCLVAVILYFTVSSAALLGTGGGGAANEDAGVGLLLTNITQLPQLFQGIVGGSLGWFDTNMPAIVTFIGVMVVGALLYRGLAQASTRQMIAMGIAGSALILVPLAYLQSQNLNVGELVQPRYILPLLTVLIATAALSSNPMRRLALPRAPAYAIGLLLSLSACVAYWVNIQRYIAGQFHPLIEGTLPIKWNPLLHAPLVPVSIVTALATIAWVLGIFLWARTSNDRVPSSH